MTVVTCVKWQVPPRCWWLMQWPSWRRRHQAKKPLPLKHMQELWEWFEFTCVFISGCSFVNHEALSIKVSCCNRSFFDYRCVWPGPHIEQQSTSLISLSNIISSWHSFPLMTLWGMGSGSIIHGVLGQWLVRQAFKDGLFVKMFFVTKG